MIYTDENIKTLEKTRFVDTGLQVQVKKLKKRRYSRTYQVVIKRQGKLHNLGVLGSVNDIRLSEAIRLKNAKISEFDSLNNHNIRFIDFYKNYIYKPPKNGAKDRNNFLMKYCEKIHNKSICKITLADIYNCLNVPINQGYTPSLVKLSGLLSRIMKHAKVYGFVKDSYSDEISTYTKIHKTKMPKQGTFGGINKLSDLKELLKFTLSLDNDDLKNLIKIQIITGLRPSNARLLSTNQIKNDDDWGYHLFFLSDETKQERDELIGLPLEVYNWLYGIKNNDISDYLVLNNRTKKPYSDNFVRFNLASFKPSYIIGNQKIVPHSLRKIISTFSNEYSKYSKQEIESILWHSSNSEVQKVYDMSPQVNKTREILTFWLDFLDKLCVEIGYLDGFLKG